MEVSSGKPFLFPHGSFGVVLLHSYTSSSADMRMLARHLERQNYTIYAPVFTGHGRDPLTVLKKGNPDDWWVDTQFAIRKLKDLRMEKIAVLGLSLGGLLATKALENDPSLAGGGVFASPVTTWGKSNVPQFFPRLAATYYQNAGLSLRQITERIAEINQLLPRQLTEISQMTREIDHHLDRIHQPFFIGQGGKDEMIDPHSGEKLKNKLLAQGTPVDYHYYPQAGHVLTVNDAHRQLFTDVTNFLQKIFEV
ncbi:alpha/beta hydrolase [Limosilactobacillus fastidiosus]|uniref:Alpha/beta fold hydrolase n=1 Tax=Limosilactobacillus fastidiosus TaxID=2759855 RepID=A0A7W3YCG7_9LACO|nr:alpha/beta fold hydrolase [Limosilactobacillus fastidiosus]MBB1063258.1 alpha/beta fold hydrolase [Limosilactobacillus fastidiosus]MBB1086101.1 alpha/beta fold hydrolase [Limosilactobacillus fastidiosus]MCD7084489.1 alpha/beta fold hydrolase [Limosilactobacillus fastidiosus]MCD7085016.1 alpha/beta fold hydrolase [Limosilactobacillus fastidiosus]MCD7114528.1 alpha/beta fold hydrolase [Limosilactobacillus fastidiosus]